MSCSNSTLSESTLFKAVKKSELFAKLVENSCKLAEIIGKRVVAIFDEYTPHDLQHCRNAIADLENKLLDSEKLDEILDTDCDLRETVKKLKKVLGLSLAEVQLLIRGILLHDVGMAPPNDVFDEFVRKCEQEYEAYREKYGQENLAKAELIREHHQDLSSKVLEKYKSDLYGEHAGEYWAREELKVLKFVVRHHRTPIDGIPNYARKEFGRLAIQIDYPGPIGQQQVRPALIAALVQLADELDIDSKRVNRLAYKMFIENPKSKAHWLSHLNVSIKRDKLVHDVVLLFDGEFRVEDESDKEAIVEAYKLAVKNANKLRAKLRKFRLTEFSRESLESLYSQIPVDVLPELEAENFKVETAKIEVHGNISSLLADKLYAGEESVIIREFLANAIDSCLYRYCVDKDFRRKAVWYADWCKGFGKEADYELPYYEPDNYDIIAWGATSEKDYHKRLGEGERAIPFRVLKDCVRIDWSVNDEYIVLKFEDHGKGMTIDEIKRCFIAIGNSWWFSEDERKSFNTIAKFGVGHLSAFMLGEKIVVTTKPLGSDKAYRFELTPNVGDYITIWEVERDDYGTDMKIWIPINSDRTRKFLEKIEGEKVEEKISKWVEDSIKRWFADFTRHVCLDGVYTGITASSEVERVGVTVEIRDEHVFLRFDENCKISMYLDGVGCICAFSKNNDAEMGQKIEIEHDLPCSVNVEFSDILSRDLSKFRAYIGGEIEKLVSAVLILEALRKDCFITELFLPILSKFNEEFYRTVLTLAQNKWKFNIEERIIIKSSNTGLFRLSDVWQNCAAVIMSQYFDPECLEKYKSELEELNVLVILSEGLPVPFAKALGYSVENIRLKRIPIHVIFKNNIFDLVYLIRKLEECILRNLIVLPFIKSEEIKIQKYYSNIRIQKILF